jgi:transaldolase
MPTDGGNADETLAAHAAARVDVDALAAKLQADAATSFVEAWNDLLTIIDKQSAALTA